MVLTPSQMVPLGTALPLPLLTAELASGGAQQVSGSPDLQQALASGSLAGRPLLVLFICAHCPFVKHIEAEISRLQRDLPEVQLIAISSNSILSHPQDGPEGLQAQASAHGWTFPYLFDAGQRLAQGFTAACTPDPFLYRWDAAAGCHQLAYRGQLDASRPGNDLPCDGADIRAAMAALLEGRPEPREQRPSIGCNIKWRAGEEPEWAR